jgi:thimet oligopeptidase
MTTPWKNAAALEAACKEGIDDIGRQRAALKTMKADLAALGAYNSLLVRADGVAGLAGLMSNVHPDKTAREASEACERSLQKLMTEIGLDHQLYQVLAAVEPNTLDPLARRFHERTLRDFRRSGVDKDEPTRKRLQAIHDEMVELGQTFDRNIRDDQRSIEVEPAELKGLPEDFVAAHKPNDQHRVTVTTNYPDYFPIQNYAESEGLRKRLAFEFLNRGHPKNGPVLEKLLALRHEYATTLGFPTWAEYQAEDKMVRSAGTIEKFIAEVEGIARPRMKNDLAELLLRKKKDDPKAKAIESWDRFYYVDKVRAEKYGFDSKSVRPYFEYQRVLAGMLDLYGELFGLLFTPAKDAEVWHPNVQAFDVTDKSTGAAIGRFYLDMHPREGKYSHAAMFQMVTGLAGGQAPQAALVCNFPDPASAPAGQPALMEHTDVSTMFHEFGHLIHHLLARGSPWVNQCGISTEWDFVEAPSQLLEEWTWDPAVLHRFATHVTSNEPIPAPIVAKMRAAEEFGKGVVVMRQLFYAALSYYAHARDPKGMDLLTFQREIQAKYSPYPYLEDTHEYEGFGHIEGYSSMYYTYQWSLALAKDIFTRFQKSGLLDAATAADYKKEILLPGGSKDAAELVQTFLGRPHDLVAYKKWLEAE